MSKIGGSIARAFLDELPCDSEPKDVDETRFQAWKKDDGSGAAKTLKEAAALIDGDSARQHGDKHDLYDMTANLWSAYLMDTITPHQVAIMMALGKIARSHNGTKHNHDNYVDGAGYLAIAAELAEENDHGC